MKIETVILQINELCSQNKFQLARTLIESEWKRIIEFKNYGQLNTNAQEFIKIIKRELEATSLNSLTITEKRIIQTLNSYVSETNFSYARRVYLQHIDLFERPESALLLTSDAQIICNALKKECV